jgi:PAS domain S-box-containing protein
MTAPVASMAMDKPEWLTNMEGALETLNEGVIITDEQQRILFANSRFIEMTAIPRQDLTGAYASQFYSLQEWDFVAAQIQAEFEHGQNRYTFVLPRKDGGRLPVIISSRTLENSGSQFGIVTFTDISEQVRVAEELRSANAMLQKRQMEIDEDSRLAARVQRSLAPKSQVWNGLRIESFYHAVHSVGGDFTVVNSQDAEHTSLLVGDVSGHGIGAALVANRVYSETLSHMHMGMPFSEMFTEMNRFLIEEIDAGMFITVAAASIDTRLRRMIFAGAGHPPAFLVRRGQRPLLLESRSAILGALPDAVDTTSAMELHLEPGDRIVLYTDGITEVFNSRGEMLGTEGVREMVHQASTLPAEEMKQAILEGVAAWRNGPPTDDVSLVLVYIL